MSKREVRGFCFFGGFYEGYPRSEVIRKGLEKRGMPVVVCRTSPKRRLAARYAVLLVRYFFMRRPFSIIFVPEFRHKDVPLAYLLGRLTGKRIVFDPLVSRFDTKIMDRGDAGVRSFQAWHNRNLDRLSLALPDLVLADTGVHAEYYAAEFGVEREKIRVLPVGFDESLFKVDGAGKVSSGGRPFRVLFFGNYLPLHGVDTIVSAAALLRARTDIEFILIGRGQTYSSVAAYVERERLQNVTLRPRVPMEELSSEIACSDVCLGIFGRTEKAGRVVANKVYQSVAMGKPVITGDSVAAREFFSDGEDICLVPPGSAEALAEKIEELCSNPGVAARIGARAARAAREKFTSEAVAGTLVAYCGEIL